MGTVSTEKGAQKMDRKAISERLRVLASDDKKRSKAARLRDVIDDIEAALAAGVPRAAVVETLVSGGLDMSLGTFETTLKRIRQKRGKASIPTAKPAGRNSPASPREVPAVEDEPEATGNGSHKPEDLDAIIGSKPDLAGLANLVKKKRK